MKMYVFKLLEKYDHDWKSIYKAIKKGEFVSNAEIEKYSHYKDYFSMLEDDYPDPLKDTSTPPFVLFYKGDRSIFKKLEFSTFVYGGNQLTEYGKKLCTKIVKKCKHHNNVLICTNTTETGKYIMNLALENNVRVLCVLSSGRSKIESFNKKITYATIFLDDTESTEEKMKASQWLGVALSHRCIIPEIELNFKKLNIVDECLTMGKKVYAYPGNVTNFNQGTNYLIKQGATLLM